jgi:hypothetical protein
MIRRRIGAEYLLLLVPPRLAVSTQKCTMRWPSALRIDLLNYRIEGVFDLKYISCRAVHHVILVHDARIVSTLVQSTMALTVLGPI